MGGIHQTDLKISPFREDLRNLFNGGCPPIFSGGGEKSAESWQFKSKFTILGNTGNEKVWHFVKGSKP